MSAFRIQKAAACRLDEIYRYTQARWGAEQANRYISGLFEVFAKIESHAIQSRPIPAAFGVEGFFLRYEKHFIYWRPLSNGDIGIVTVLHERMHQVKRLRTDFDL